MRQIAGTVIIATLAMLAAVSADADKLSVNQQHSHNSKRVMAKLAHVSGARDMLERRVQRLKKPEIDARTPEMKAAEAVAAREQAEMKAKIDEAESRQMNVQAREQKPGINAGVQQFFQAPHCNSASTFRVLETRFHDVCARMDFSFVRRHWQDLGSANRAYEKFCTSACAGTINDLLQHTEGYTCFQSDVLTELRLFSAMCQLSTNIPPGAYWTQQRCGAEVAVSGVFDGATSHCESPTFLTSKTMCDTDMTRCQWDNDMKQCAEKMTPAVIARECTDCYINIVDVISTEYNSVCAKKGGQFCLPKLFDFNRLLQKHNFDFSKAMFDEVCSDNLLLPCFRAMDAGSDNRDLMMARQSYTMCIKYGFGESNCAPLFRSVQQRIDSNTMLWSQTCSKNATGANADYCYRSSQGLTASNYAGAGMCDSTMSTCGSPATACVVPYTRFLQEAGCCAAYYDFDPMTKSGNFPEIQGETQPTGAQLSRVNTDYTFLNVSQLEFCSGSMLFDWKAAMCPNPRGFSAPISFWTVLNHAAATANPVRLDGIIFALKLDIGKAAGIVATDLNITLTAATSAAGVMGTTVAFSIRGTATFAADAKIQWDASVAHRAMTTTDNAIRTCMQCKPEKEASIIPRVFAVIPGAPSDACNTQAFFTGYKAMVTACSDSKIDAVFGMSTGNLNTANAGWGAACGSQCLVEFKKLKASAYATCIPTEVSTLGDLMNVACTKDTANANYCGAVLSVMGGTDCSSLDETTCRMNTGAGAQCRWNNKTSSCKDQFKSTFLQPLCDGGCITKMAATIGMNGDSFGREAKLLDTLFCSKDGAQLCMPLIQNEINQIDEFGLTVKVVNDVCTHREKLRCMKRVYAAIASDSLGFAEEDFYHCVETVLDDGSVSHYQKVNRIETSCIENVLAATLSAVDQTNAMLDNMCSKNQHGKYCMSFPAKYGDNECLTNMLFNNNCPSSCVNQIDMILDDIGCCSGNLQQVHGFLPFANLPQEDVPEFEVFDDFGGDFGGVITSPPTIVRDFQGPQPGSAGGGAGVGMVARSPGFTVAGFEQEVMTPKWYFLANYETCRGGQKQAGDLVYKKCRKVRGGQQQNRTLNLGISFETISATAKKQKRFEKKLQTDLSIHLGLSADDFPSLGMKKDTSRPINLAPAGGPPPRPNRRSTTTATSASTSSISMQTENDADTNSSAAAYDTAVADGTLTLSSTISLVKNECSNCTSAGTDYTSVSTTTTSETLTATTPAASSSASSAGPATSSTSSSPAETATPTTSSAGGSGASTTSVVAAAVVAVVFAALSF